MKLTWSALYLSILLLIISSCNTLYNSRSVNLEIVEPGNVIFPDWVNSIAVRYNNSNVSYNPSYEAYTLNHRAMADETNSDSIASKLYYSSFLEILKNNLLFEKVTEIEPGGYSNVCFNFPDQNDSLNDKSLSTRAIELFCELLSENIPNQKRLNEYINIDPEYGLYTKDDLEQIRDSTGTDLLLSLDFFAMNEELEIKNAIPLYINEYLVTWWNFYDLTDYTLQYFYNRIDTVSWTYHNSLYQNELPDRNVAIKNAAIESGQKFAEFLIPHWIEVSRTFYRSGNIELKKAEKLYKENKWMEAAKIWKANTKNPNKNIAAKSMFNLALACEIEGNLDAAIDWVVKSYKVFEQKNQVHEFNCYEYIRVLAQRKLDLRKINIQLNQMEAGP